MKKLLICITLLAVNFTLFSQAPQKMSYQAVIRNTTGGLVTSHSVGMRISILQGSASGTAVYVETHTTTTNANGLATIEIGGGSVVSGTFTGINWGTGTYYLKTEADPTGGSNYTVVGTSQLLSVPYALFAKTGGGLALPYDGLVTSASGPGFRITNSANNAIEGYAQATSGVYYGIDGSTNAPDGAGVHGTNNSTSGAAHGVMGYSHSSTGYGVYGQSVGIGVRGDGRIGIEGFSSVAQYYGVHGEFQSETNFGSGIYGSTKSSQGYGVFGRATSSSGLTAGVAGETMSSTGTGIWGLASNISGANYGVRGTSNSTDGVGVNGKSTGGIGVLGEGNIGIKGEGTTNGYSGYFSGGRFYVKGNVGLGDSEPDCKLKIVSPTAAGDVLNIVQPSTGYYIIRIRESTSTGSGLIYVYDDENNPKIQLYAEGTSFINGGSLGIGTESPTQALHVVGNAYKTVGGTTWATSSDLRLKKILGDYESGLDEIIALQPVRFIYNPGNPRDLDCTITQVGFVAQDVQKIFPDAVSEAKDGYLDFNMHEINVALVNAVKELKAENDRLRSENADITLRLERLEAKIGK